MHDIPFLTYLCISPGTQKELSALVVEFHRQDYPPSLRELVIIDDGPVNQQPALTALLSLSEEEISVRYHHSPQRLFAEEKVRLGAELARGDWFHFITVNTHYPGDYFRCAITQAQSSTEKITGLARETLWLSPLKRLCYRNTHLPWYSALNALCCHRSVLENGAFLLSADGREASLTRPFVETVEMTPVTYCHNIMAIIRNGLLINTKVIDHTSELLREFQFIDPGFFYVNPPAMQYYDIKGCIRNSRLINNKIIDYLSSEIQPNERQPEKTIDWGFFHRIACISLNEGTARARSFREQLETLQVPEKKTLWFQAHKGHSPVAGRMQAWLEILRTARDNSWENVLVLEDDIQFVRQESMVEKINALLASLAGRPWKAVLFSAQYQDVSLLTEIKDVVTVRNAAAIGACAVHGSYFAVLIAFFEELLNRLMSEQNSQEIQPDHFWHILMKNDSWLGLWPSWGFQAAEFNDVHNSVTDPVPLFFRPLLALDSDMRSRIEGPLLEKVKHVQATPQVWAALAQLNHEMQRYELRDYYQFKASGRLPPVRRKNESWPLLSVLITAYNQVEHLKETLESVFLQSYPNLEIIVADDCSTDGTQRYMESITDPRLRYVRNAVNLGLAGNYQSAFEQHAQGDYFYSIAHDDMLIDRYYLWNAVLVLEKNKNLSLVCSNYYEWFKAENKITHAYSGIIINNGKEYFLNYWKFRNPSSLVTVYRRQNLIQARAIDYEKHSQVEDVHLTLRALLFGDVDFIPVFSAIYRIHENNFTDNQSDDGDISMDISFIRDMEKTRALAVRQDAQLPSDWFTSVVTFTYFQYWRLPFCIRKKRYGCILSVLAWLNKYYPDIGRNVLINLLEKR